MVRVVGEMLQVSVSEGQRITLKIFGIFFGRFVGDTRLLFCFLRQMDRWRHLHGWAPNASVTRKCCSSQVSSASVTVTSARDLCANVVLSGGTTTSQGKCAGHFRRDWYQVVQHNAWFDSGYKFNSTIQGTRRFQRLRLFPH